MSSSIRFSGIVLFVSILSFPLSLFAAPPLMMESGDNAIILQAPEQSVLSASETVASDQGIPEAEPVIVSRDLMVLDTAIGVSIPPLEFEEYVSERVATIETGGRSTPQEGKDAKPHPTVANQAVDAAELQHIPIAVVLGLIALIAVVPISRRGVMHTWTTRVSKG